MVPGGGLIAMGPGYRHHLFGDAAVLNTSAAISWRRYSMVQSQIEWPKLFEDHLSVGVAVKYQDFTQINYFGVGPETSESAQTDYRLKSVDVVGSVTAHPRDGLSVGGRVGYIRGLSIERGLSSLYPSTTEVFDETTAPGLTVQPRYQHADVFLEADSRDVPGYPTSGGVYHLGLTNFYDLDGSGHSFRRVDADVTQHMPLFHKNWIVTVRGRVALSQTSAGQEVPFYLMPTMGGDKTLRGYSSYRFRDRNVAMFNAEYRWPVFRMMDAALFADVGRVAPTMGGLWREQLHRDYGFGLRLHTATKSIATFNLSRGQEGARISVSLSAPFGRASRSVIPYVP
jgi:outer membrane protein assembly factor BamA